MFDSVDVIVIRNTGQVVLSDCNVEAMNTGDSGRQPEFDTDRTAATKKRGKDT